MLKRSVAWSVLRVWNGFVMKKNKVTTLGYFVKRMRDNGYITNKIFNGFAPTDPRKWMVMINPGAESIIITCCENRDYFGQKLFDISDGNQRIPNTLSLSTDSVEVVITYLSEFNVFAPAAADPENK